MAADPAGGTDPLGPADPQEAVRAELQHRIHEGALLGELVVVIAQYEGLAMPVEFSLETMNHFIYWNRSDPYKVERGEGECAV